jgi:glycosyltransferase involved in cell wall biosynthesis
VIAFAVGGLASSIVDGKTGFLIQPGDYREFFNRQRELLLNPGKAMAMGAAGRSHIQKTYSVELSRAEFQRALKWN